MATFFKRKGFVYVSSDHAGLSLGSNFAFKIPREGYISNMWLVVYVHVGTAAATLSPGGLYDLIKSFSINIPNESSRNLISNMSGRGMIEYVSQLQTFLTGKSLQGLALDTIVTDPTGGATVDSQSRTAVSAILTALRGYGLVGATAGTGTFRICIPIPCCHPQVASPIKELFALPASRWPSQDAILSGQLGSQSDVDTNGSATFALGANKIWMKLVYEYFVPPAEYDVFQWEMTETEYTVGSSSGNQEVLLLPTDGQLSGLLIRSWSAANTRGSITNDIGTPTAGMLQLMFNKVTMGQWDDDMMKDINDPTTLLGQINKFAGIQFLDFLTDGNDEAVDLGGLLDLNLAPSVKPKLYQDIESGLTGAKNRFVWHKINGQAADLLKIVNRV